MIIQPKIIIWDWNGTLVQDDWLCCELLNELTAEHGLPTVSLESYKDHFTFPISKYYEFLGFDAERIPYEDMSQQFMGNYEKRRLECQLYAGVPEALAKVRELGIRQSILSAYLQETLETLVAHYGLTDYFEKICGAKDIYGHGKTDAAHVLIEQLAIDSQEVLLIGDTLHDAEVAEAIGVRCALVACGYQSRKRLASAGFPVYENAAAVIADLAN